jgi:hypothetical protein
VSAGNINSASISRSSPYGWCQGRAGCSAVVVNDARTTTAAADYRRLNEVVSLGRDLEPRYDRLVDGGYYEGLLPADPAPIARDAAALRFWRATARLCGWDYTAARSPVRLPVMAALNSPARGRQRRVNIVARPVPELSTSMGEGPRPRSNEPELTPGPSSGDARSRRGERPFRSRRRRRHPRRHRICRSASVPGHGARRTRCDRRRRCGRALGIVQQLACRPGGRDPRGPRLRRIPRASGRCADRRRNTVGLDCADRIRRAPGSRIPPDDDPAGTGSGATSVVSSLRRADSLSWSGRRPVSPRG